MRSMKRGRRRARLLAMLTAATTVAAVSMGSAAQASTPANWRLGDYILDFPTKFYVEDDSNAARQAATWQTEGRMADAAAMRKLAKISQATWFTGGTPLEVQAQVNTTMKAATKQHAVPVLVAYNVPGRDCSQYSAGGAPTEQAYKDWIDGFSHGIGNRPAVVILEPDGLALLSSEPWCGEAGGGSTGQPEDRTREDERFREIRYAVERLRGNPLTAIYLDAGHSAWHDINDYEASYGDPREQLGMASRLLRAGVDRATGFFLNVSNYRTNDELITFGTRLSKCLYLRQQTGMTSCSETDLAAVTVKPSRLTHFVLDTSRNGQGNWVPPPGLYSDPQDWCNPPGRGLGSRPTTRTNNALVDAFLWVKRPGESDGSCTRGTAGPTDPEYGVVDPVAGAWWGDYALGLAQRANPPLT
jgi:endoglucanase